ncbi:PAS domain protein [Roseibium sp. TrichSKD4]|uniref:PAS-domain containing protein n=1 Tax=Roseibium sp. TrichSKD4 TaxID=744980 RepID=UPI0001E56C41|nr:PAS-domain containing protein [Roseibium sp. TrichSKD4]EFO31414.1 PAS domain protein [Roseibium sp. TrichSKD4]
MNETTHLKSQLDLMQAALDHLSQGFSVFDANLELVAWNRGLWQMLDFPEELARRGTHLTEFLRVNAERGEYGEGDIEGKIERRVARARLFEPHYLERVRPNGQVIAIKGTPLPQGGFVTTYTDVTEDRRRQESLEKTVEERTRALRQSEDWLRLVTDNIPALIAYIAPGPIFRFANRRYAEWFGQSPASIVGMSGQDVVGKDLFAEIGPKIAHALQGNLVSYDYQRKQTDGSKAYMRSTLIPDMTVDGRTLGAFVLSLDATEEKQNQESLLQAQRMDAVGKLSGGLAHDFNNLLTILMGNLLTLKRKSGDISTGELEKHLEPMLTATQRGSDLTQRLLAFSRGHGVDPQIVSLTEVISNVGTLLSGSLPASVTVNFHIDQSVRLFARIDPTQLETALVNLAFNARDAMPEGGELSISLAQKHLEGTHARNLGLSTGDYALITVRDTGEGMEEDIQLKAFEPFFTTKSFGTGSGLGLSMVYGFIQQSEGVIDIRSKRGAGTEIQLFLPLQSAPENLTATSEVGSKALEDNALRGNGELVLLVEDNPDVAAVLAVQVQDLGYSVLVAEGAEDARSLASELPDLSGVLSDIVMPGQMNGLSLARKIKAARPKLGIALMTGYANWSSDDDNSNHCEFPVLPKPFESESLARTLKDITSS